MANNVPGDYNITTNTIGGISFSCLGNIFKATGDQQVTLSAAGTPSSSGFYYFTLNGRRFTQCTFRIAVISPDPLATYVLESGTGNNTVYCTPQSIQGTYTANVPLNASNTITITAYPTVLGNYTISTDLFNGIIFSTSGTFTTMADQSVVLYGSGTPIQSGTFTFCSSNCGAFTHWRGHPVALILLFNKRNPQLGRTGI